MTIPSEAQHTLDCRHCGASNRFPVTRALEDLHAVVCGRCSGALLRVQGEPLTNLTDEDLTHPFDRQALEKLRAIPMLDTLMSRAMGSTMDKFYQYQYLANAVRISETQAPRLWRLHAEAAARLNMEPVPLFLAQSPLMNAMAYGASEPFIVVTSALVDGMGDDEIRGVLGHELTHVRLGHVLYRMVADVVVRGGVGMLSKFIKIGSVLLAPLQMALFKWSQMAELSADRGELIASGSLRTAVRAHMLLAGGSRRYLDELDETAFMAQADEAEEMRDHDMVVWAMDLMNSSFRAHPYPVWRVHHLQRFARSEPFFRLLAGEHLGRIGNPT